MPSWRATRGVVWAQSAFAEPRVGQVWRQAGSQSSNTSEQNGCRRKDPAPNEPVADPHQYNASGTPLVPMPMKIRSPAACLVKGQPEAASNGMNNRAVRNKMAIISRRMKMRLFWSEGMSVLAEAWHSAGRQQQAAGATDAVGSVSL